MAEIQVAEESRNTGIAGWLVNRLGIVPAAALLTLLLMAAAAVYVKPSAQCMFFGEHFQKLSEGPFDFPERNHMQQRLLSPIIGYILGLRGALYIFLPLLFYWMFSFSVFVWLYVRNKFSATESWLGTAVLTFSTTFLFTLVFPGYSDTSSYFFLFLTFVLLERGSPLAALFQLLAALNHEGNLFLLPLFLWMAATHGDAWKRWINIPLLLASVPLLMIWRQLLKNMGPAPLTEYSYFDSDLLLINLKLIYAMLPLGIFMAFRLLWALPVMGVAATWKSGEKRDTITILLGMVLALSQLVFASDVSRLMGMAFPSVLMGMIALRKQFGPEKFCRWLLVLFLLNLFVLPYYVGQEIPQRMFSLPEYYLYVALGLMRG